MTLLKVLGSASQVPTETGPLWEDRLIETPYRFLHGIDIRARVRYGLRKLKQELAPTGGNTIFVMFFEVQVRKGDSWEPAATGSRGRDLEKIIDRGFPDLQPLVQWCGTVIGDPEPLFQEVMERFGIRELL